jgi:hypothetical protein
MTTKAQMLQAIRELPDDATVEDAMERASMCSTKSSVGSSRPMLARRSPRKKPVHA